MNKSISKETLKRLPQYLNYLKTLPQEGPCNISSTTIAAALGLNYVQVRKDLSAVSCGGRPKIGYITKDLIYDIEEFLGYNNTKNAVIVGVGNLGHALLSYNGFVQYGMEIVLAFDSNESVIGTVINGKQVLPVSKLKDLCNRIKIRIGIITVPAPEAQEVCDMLIESGILAIWNFAPVHLRAPNNVLVQNVNVAASLAILSKHLSEKLNENA